MKVQMNMWPRMKLEVQNMKVGKKRRKSKTEKGSHQSRFTPGSISSGKSNKFYLSVLLASYQVQNNASRETSD